MLKHAKTHFDIFALVFSLIIASILRIAVPFNMVFHNGKIIFNSLDAYYQLRFADLITAHYPQTNFYDPYFNAPFNQTPLFNLLLAWLGRIFGNLDMVAAYLPAILGILTLIPVYIIAKSIFNNKWITSLAVLFIAILPGLFFNRTQLGAADYHCLEIFLSSMMMMWGILAFKEKWAWLKICYGGLAFLTFGFYFLAWKGSLVFVGILAVFLYVWAGLSWAKKHPSIKYNIIPHGFVAAIIAGVIIYAYIGEPNQFQALVRYGVDIVRWKSDLVAAEEMPLLFLGQASGSGVLLDLRTVWGYFGFLFFFALTGLGMLIYRILKYRQPAEIMLLAWSVVILLLTLAMRRWAYYFAVNVAILSAYSCYVIGKAFIIKRVVVVK
jgi:dolichyl-diphosphooligosaccharide--protein glycosyltransferase